MTTTRTVSSLKEVPITVQRPVPHGLDKYIPEPGLPRANTAVSKENPTGNPSAPRDMTTLQQHMAWWDRDHDGIIWPSDTYVGFRRLGFSYLVSALAIPVIHGTFSYPTVSGILPDLFMRIFLKNAHRTKHGSDSEVYDTEGRFVPIKFEELFSKHDIENKGGLTFSDLTELCNRNMNVMDPVGWIAERLEWYVFYVMAKNEAGLVTKDKILGLYDGRIWQQIADQVDAKKAGPALKVHTT